MSILMGDEPKQKNTDVVLEYIKNSALPVTRQELVRAMPQLTKDQIRKVTNDMVNSKRLIVETDNLGVPRYRLGHIRVKPVKVEKPNPPKTRTKKPSTEVRIAAAITDKPEDHYQKGYYDGYNEAMFHSQREAYNAGRKAVLKGLTKLLGVDAEVLL